MSPRALQWCSVVGCEATAVGSLRIIGEPGERFEVEGLDGVIDGSAISCRVPVCAAHGGRQRSTSRRSSTDGDRTRSARRSQPRAPRQAPAEQAQTFERRPRQPKG